MEDEIIDKSNLTEKILSIFKEKKRKLDINNKIYMQQIRCKYLTYNGTLIKQLGHISCEYNSLHVLSVCGFISYHNCILKIMNTKAAYNVINIP